MGAQVLKAEGMLEVDAASDGAEVSEACEAEGRQAIGAEVALEIREARLASEGDAAALGSHVRDVEDELRRQFCRTRTGSQSRAPSSKPSYA